MTHHLRAGILALGLWACASPTPRGPSPSIGDVDSTPLPYAWLADFAAMQRLEELADLDWKNGAYSRAAAYFIAAAEHAQRVPSPTGDDLRITAARALMRAGDADGALVQLRASVAAGFRNDRLIQTHEDFTRLRAHPALSAIVASAQTNSRAYAASHRRVEDVRLEFSDVARFWAAYDLAAEVRGLSAKARIFRRHYLGEGTAGLIDYYHLKTESSEALVAQLNATPGYYEGIRARTSSAEALAPQIRDGLRSLLELYPDAVVPDVTFVIGRLNSGGTAGPSGMPVGLDIWSWQEGIELDGISPGMQELLRSSSLEDLPFVVIHEHVHSLQVFAKEETLLDQALAEGSADFLASLALPKARKRYYHQWGLDHETEVWRDFQGEMDGVDASRWIANLSTVEPGRSADLGYFVGARICEAYYAQAKDKAQAIRDILFVNDSKAFLKQSGYPQRFH